MNSFNDECWKHLLIWYMDFILLILSNKTPWLTFPMPPVFVLIIYCRDYCHKGTHRGKNSISVLRKSDRAWPPTGNHMLSVSSLWDVCWEENHETFEEDIVTKKCYGRESLKPEDLQKWMLGLNILACDILKIEFSVLFLQQWLGFLNCESLKNIFIFTSNGDSCNIWWYPCVAQEFGIGEFWQDRLSDLAKSNWPLSFET